MFKVLICNRRLYLFSATIIEKPELHMGIPLFKFNAVLDYSPLEKESIQKKDQSLSANSLSLAYNQSSKIFTVPDSPSLKSEEIEKNFLKNKYHGWSCIGRSR